MTDAHCPDGRQGGGQTGHIYEGDWVCHFGQFIMGTMGSEPYSMIDKGVDSKN